MDLDADHPISAVSQSDGEENYEELNAIQNRKQKRAGGWQSMGLDYAVYKGILRKGYKQPTPIQRKSIPLVCSGRDVVAMSRTGSGKTAAFVVPMLQRLKKRDTRGIRAVLLSPTRELALQTFKIVKELGRFMGLYCACLIGGDKMDEQFEVLHQHPDILLATPGRLMHLIIEMNLKLNSVQYIVFDEADRLFEMGFADQMKEIMSRIPESRQTLLFSATLPKMLVDFAKAGLSDPELVRLDVETKLSEKLNLVFANCRQTEKLPVMLSLCRALDRQAKKTIVFCATMKHVEHLVAVLQQAGLDPAFLYSQLDPVARRQNIARFRNEQCPLLIVTDIAARGVDIPLLDFAVNYHFPSKPKLFVHRVGRVARAGKAGTAISFVAPDEMAHLLDLFLFIGRPMQFVQPGSKSETAENNALIGTFPENMAHIETEFLHNSHQNYIELKDLQHTAENSMKKYQRTRPQASAESIRRVKAEFRQVAAGPHPFFLDAQLFPENALEAGSGEAAPQQQQELLQQLKCWRPNQAVFEIQNSLGGVGTFAKKEEEQSTIEPKKKRISRAEERKEEERAKHFVNYQPADANTESGLQVRGGSAFEAAARGEHLELAADDEKGLYVDAKRKKWDRKRKKFVSAAAGGTQVKKIRTEEGTLLPASYKSGRYEKWKQRQKVEFQQGAGEEEGADEESGDRKRFNRNKWKRGAMAADRRETATTGKQGRIELRNVDQIVKSRNKRARVQAYQSHRREENLKRKNRANGKFGATNKGRTMNRGGGQKSGRRGRANGSGRKS